MQFVTLITLGLLASVGFMWRELRRAPLMPPDYDAEGEPTKDWSAGVKLDSNANDQSDAAIRARLLEKLRLEEERQRPQEGRN